MWKVSSPSLMVLPIEQGMSIQKLTHFNIESDGNVDNTDKTENIAEASV